MTSIDWCKLSRSLIEEFQLQSHQVIGVLHSDRCYAHTQQTRVHLHLVFNAVSDRGRCGNFSWDYSRLERFLRGYEQKYQLTQVPSSWRQNCSSYQSVGEPQKLLKQELKACLSKAIRVGQTWQEIQNFLQEQEITVLFSARGWSLVKDAYRFTGSQLGMSYQYANDLLIRKIEKRLIMEEFEERERQLREKALAARLYQIIEKASEGIKLARTPREWKEEIEKYSRGAIDISLIYEGDRPSTFTFAFVEDPELNFTCEQIESAAGLPKNYYSPENVLKRFERNQPNISEQLLKTGEALDSLSQGFYTYDSGIDGIDLIRTSLKSFAAASFVASRIFDTIQKGKLKLSERNPLFDDSWAKLEDIAQITDRLQGKTENLLLVAQAGETQEIETQAIVKKNDEVDENDRFSTEIDGSVDEITSIVSNIEWTSRKIRLLEEILAPEQLSRPMSVELSDKSLAKQLDTIQRSLEGLNERLGLLEKKIDYLEREYQPILHSNGVVSSCEIVEAFEQHFQARREFGQISTSSDGVERYRTQSKIDIALYPNRRLTLTTDSGQLIFDAQYQESKYKVAVNRLNLEQVDAILALPRSSAQIWKRQKETELVEMILDSDRFIETDNYSFKVLKKPDGSQLVLGQSNNLILFKAEVNTDGKIKVQENQLASETLYEIICRQSEKTSNLTQKQTKTLSKSS